MYAEPPSTSKGDVRLFSIMFVSLPLSDESLLNLDKVSTNKKTELMGSNSFSGYTSVQL